ncbi:hypothetical protein MA20_22275 [Bradyrhizobium japonicum]|uniref:NACHT C-terminal Alpha/Beta 2 domain-containing protein n=1 Tax=Bradyrhizobium japonicum TaxID=375 RepID=A0A0A3XS90_BRAJP|nr:HNH endonuclease [Bradyrhizobium japonicum]KGT77322.1 hypothetical protein MA20_22275 [Bradyrhizobium japonicum]
MAKKSRDDFTVKTVLQIAKRAGWLCCFPSCRTSTVGATEDGRGEINIGTAAHICAAAPGGPRYDENMSENERSSAENGIWMCRDHGKAIDSDVKQFTTTVLREWKKQAELESWQRVLRNEVASSAAAASDADLAKRFRAAAENDLCVFRQTSKWPRTSVALRLEVDGFDTPVTTDALARAVTSLDDLILVAGPGMGKTTTVFQVAEGILETSNGTPLVVMLNDWATESATILESILKRPAFKGILEDDLRRATAQPGVVLLLDGWNELDAESRKRARVQISTLKAGLPELGLVVSARKPRNQALDVPFGGKRVDLLPLNHDQQMQIARDVRGEDGARLVDQAWRTAGVRELVTIPLYLTALLSLPNGMPFPTTKEEVLRHFVAAHEVETGRAEAMHAVVQDLQQDYLEALAVLATHTANTAVSDSNARRSVSDTAAFLVNNGQITIKPEPNAVLDVLVSNHVLMRAGDTPGLSFQHQQFQEWYASHIVERRIIAEVDDLGQREALKAEIFNFPAWEEAILFAIERMSRSDEHHRAASGKAILAAFEVDPILAAEMIFRSTDDVWMRVSTSVQGRIARWHAPGKVDRAFRFMLTSGRSEFFDLVWPLITDENEQTSLKALRNCKRFRSTILGKDAVQKIKALPQKPRLVLLHEIASRGGMDGLDLATGIAKDDPEPEVKSGVIEALAFRRADRHVADILRKASEKTFDLVSRRDLIDEVDDEDVRQGIEAARKRLAAEETTVEHRLRRIAHAEALEDCSAELTTIISTMEIDKKQDAGVRLIYEARNRYPRAVADGLLARVRASRKLFYGADDMLASAGFIIEDEELLNLALATPASDETQADAAASVLGPVAVGKMLDRLLALAPHVRTDRAASEAYSALDRRIAHVPGGSLVEAVVERSPTLNSEQIARFASLLSRGSDGDSDRARPFNADGVRTVRELVEEWGKRMLASGDAERWHKAAVATLASHVSDVSLLPLLKQMNDDNLRRYRDFRAQAEAEGWRHGRAVDEARTPHTHEYQRAFLAIKVPETAALMREYLEDEHFGALAALVLADQWRAANEPRKDNRFLGGIDWSDVQTKRAARAANPVATCDEAEAIFAAIDRLIVDGTTKNQHLLAVSLGIVGLRLPHGQRDATIRNLISIAPREGHQVARSDLLLSLVLSGEEVNFADVADGIDETLEAAKTQSWILTQSDGYGLKVWLRLLPFVNTPLDGLSVLRGLPPAQRDRYFLRDLVRSYAHASPEAAEELLFKLAEADANFYFEHEWRDSVVALNTVSSARRLIDLVANGALDSKSSDNWHLARQLGGLLADHDDLRRHVYSLLKDGAPTSGLVMLAKAVAESPDEDGVLLLVKCEQDGRSFRGWRMIEQAVTEHVPVDGYQNAFNVVPVPAVELRRKLFAMTSDGGPRDVATRWLNDVDRIRDEYGLPEGEPRHPDLASGRQWPIMLPDPEATKD